MKLNSKSLKAIREYLDDPKGQDAIHNLGLIYWLTLLENIKEIINNNDNVEEFCDQETDFINWGIIEKIVDNNAEISQHLNDAEGNLKLIKLMKVTEWLKDCIKKIKSGDKQETIDIEIKKLIFDQKKIDLQINTLQKTREEQLLKEFAKKNDKLILARIHELNKIDEQIFENQKQKQAIAKGAFLSADDRRIFVDKTNKLEKDIKRRDMFFSQVRSQLLKKNMYHFNLQIRELFDKKLVFETNILKQQIALKKVEEHQSLLSHVEFYNRVEEEISYLRELVKLSASRLHMESCPILRTGFTPLTFKDLAQCLKRILEFDPKVFHNSRVEIYGKPSVLLVPGNGNGLYDWKYNRFIFPLCPPGGKFLASVATAIIEYRLDIDDDKYILGSYQKLPEQKNIKSSLQLRTNLTKDYIKWMTSEYQGFKVLEKDTRIWFEHEIAPSKHDIFCPSEYQLFEVSVAKFQESLAQVEKRINNNGAPVADGDLWAASIFNYQQGKFEKSYNYVKKLINQNPNYVFAYYNLGIVSMKNHHKQDAIASFKEFIRRNPQSWWASIARDHMRRLQRG